MSWYILTDCNSGLGAVKVSGDKYRVEGVRYDNPKDLQEYLKSYWVGGVHRSSLPIKDVADIDADINDTILSMENDVFTPLHIFMNEDCCKIALYKTEGEIVLTSDEWESLFS